LPIDVRAVLVARLDRLGQEVKDVVQTASILGREFEVQLLVRMLQNDERLLPKMTVALQAAIWIALNELRYLFKHALVHDAAYQTLVRSHRQSLHALAVEALEGLYAADLSLRYGELAYHSQQAGMVEKARAYLRQAGDTARDAYQNSQAVDYYSRALNLAPEDDLETRYNLLLSREALYNLLGNQDARRQDLEALARLAGVLDAATREDKRQAEVEELKASFAIHSGDYAGAAATAKKAVDLARTSSALDVAIRSYLTWSFALWRLGKYNTAIRRAKEGLNLARHIDDRSQQSRALNILGLIAFEQKIPKTVHLYLEESLRIAQETGNRRVEIASLNNLGNLAAALGDFTRAEESYERALRLAREIGDRIYEGRLLGNLGWTAGNLGDYVTGRTYCEQELRLAREVGDRRNESYNLINLSSLSGQQGDSRAAIAYAKQGLVLARQTHDPSCEAWALTYAGHAHLALGQVGASLKAYQDALDIRRSLGQPNLATEPLAGLGRAALAAGDISTAQAHIQAILTHLDRAGTLDGTDEPMRVYLTCYQVLLAAGDPQAGKVLETAYNLLQERSAKISDVEMRRNFLENVPYHRQILEAMNFGSTGGRASTKPDNRLS
jgi:tetratricopeptide (TPR) repeat protein